jgi:DNA-binding NtrC family response regulator
MTKKRKILVVDDDPGIREVLEGLLSRDYRVVSAADGKGALEAFRNHRPDLTLLDMFLPDANGNDLLEAFLEERPGALVVMVTGNESLEKAREAMRLGACEYVCKPFSPDHVKDLVREKLAELKP